MTTRSPVTAADGSGPIVSDAGQRTTTVSSSRSLAADLPNGPDSPVSTLGTRSINSLDSSVGHKTSTCGVAVVVTVVVAVVAAATATAAMAIAVYPHDRLHQQDGVAPPDEEEAVGRKEEARVVLGLLADSAED